MSSEDYLKEVREFYENYSAQSTRAWELHQEFYREFGERQAAVFQSISEERLASLKQLPEIETPAQLFELGVELEESAREQLTQLHSDNAAALEKHYKDLADLYTPAKEEAPSKTAQKPAAKKRAKAAA